MYDARVRSDIKSLYIGGKTISEISKISNVSRFTIKEIVTGNNYYTPKQEFIEKNDYGRNFIDNFYSRLHGDINFKQQYNYLLGLYLGDGHIIKTPRSYSLKIYNNSEQDLVIHNTNIALKTIFPHNIIGNYKQPRAKVVECGVFNNNLPIIFPQHSFGKKHDRDVSLVDWQEINIDYKFLGLGLFHSDGSFYENGNSYWMYNFTNCSIDIQKIYMKCLDKLNIRYTHSKKSIDKKNQNTHDCFITKTYRGNDVFNLYKLFGEKYFESRCENGRLIKHK